MHVVVNEFSTGVCPGPCRGRPEDVLDSWERSLLALFDDLEQQADGLHLQERQQEADELGAAEFTGVTLESRLLGSVGLEVVLQVRAGLRLRGRLARAGAGWVLLEDAQARPWLVPTAGILALSGLGRRAVHEEARSVLARLRIGSVLRRLGEERRDCVAHLLDGSRVEGPIGRVGGDFVEVGAAHGVQVVPLAALAAVTAQAGA